MCGRVMRRSKPVEPASRSRSRPVAAPRAPSRAPTLTPAAISGLVALAARLPAAGELRSLRAHAIGGSRHGGGEEPVAAAAVQVVVAARVHRELADEHPALARNDGLRGER